MNRRNFIAAASSAIAFPYSQTLPAHSIQRNSAKVRSGFNLPALQVELKAAPGQAQLAPELYDKTPVWCYNDTTPGPEIRIKQGQRLRVSFKNELQEETTIHWHGIRTPNAMDGVPHLTQIPVPPKSDFIYEFDAIDAGTFWYHPHQRSFEQVGRGLYGPLIVEEADPIRVDRDLNWVLDDWRLLQSAVISNDFGNRHDISHNGRIGNTVTINGHVPDTLSVQKGERIRLRLINAANARIFELDFDQHRPVVIAFDGQPVDPHIPENGRIILGPAMRVDLILDMTGDTTERSTVTDVFYKDLEYQLIDIQYADTALREEAPDWPMTLTANPLAEPDLQQATRHSIQFSGGMMGQRVLQEMGIQSDHKNGKSMPSMQNMMHSNKMWHINGIAAEGHIMEPMLTLRRNQHTIIDMTNATAWYHPIHFHGHSFRVLSRDGVPTKHQEWRDTVLMAPRERVEIAFVADNPGDWMFHCHILEHTAAGMMGVIRVT